MEKQLQHKERMENRQILIYNSSAYYNRPQHEALGINPTNSVVIPQSLLLRSVVGCVKIAKLQFHKHRGSKFQ